MRVSIAAVLVWASLGAPAFAQSPSAGYVEGFAQASFGNVSSQAYGGEVGVSLGTMVQVFGEFAYVKDTASSSLAANAQAIASYLSATQSNVAYHAVQPVTMGAGGIRVPFPASPKLEPYVLIGGGAAQVKKNVSFTVNGTDVTSSLSQAPYYVVLGSDLSGSETKAMITLGTGVTWIAWQKLIFDFQYRYGRVFTDEGLNINRAGVGVGVRF
jgi:opacity protein-like surface antigen